MDQMTLRLNISYVKLCLGRKPAAAVHGGHWWVLRCMTSGSEAVAWN